MATEIKMEIRNIDKFREAFKKSPEITTDEIGKALEKSARRIQGDAIKEAPVDTGYLRSSISFDLRPLEASVFSIAKYAPFVHEGTRPHFPPIDALRTWARRKLGNEDLAFAIARKIARFGTKANPFMKRAVQTNESDVRGFFREAIANIVSRLSIR